MIGAAAILVGALAATGSAAPTPRAGGISFVDVTARTGIHWTHNTGAFGQKWLPETLGPGVVVLDADGDGRPDLLFVNGSKFPGKPGLDTGPALYLNEGGMRFRDATRAFKLDIAAYCLGGAAADYDNDGDTDLYLTCVGQDHLLRNDGGYFTDVSHDAGLSEEYGVGSGVVFFDADRDGRLDIFTTRYVTWTPDRDRFCSSDGKVKAYCTAAVYPGAAAHYYHNRGDGTFEDRTRAAGLYDPEAKALGTLAVDLDGDGWPDLAVACDLHPNLLYHNRGNGTFEEIAVTAGFATSLSGGVRGGMGLDAGDYDHSGRASLAVTNFWQEMVGLYQNKGDQVFLDVAPGADVGRASYQRIGWGCLFFDYDLDGWVDLLVASGPLDLRTKAPEGDAGAAQSQLLFRNQGGGRFSDVTAGAGGDLARPLVARGAVFADLDGDGDLDVVLGTNGGPARVFENSGSGYGHWLRVSLRGTRSNRDGLGARVEVTAGGTLQTWQVHTGGSFLSQSEVDPTFGLGAAETVDKLVVRWPSGGVQMLTGLPVDRNLILVESAPATADPSPRRSAASAAKISEQ